MEFQEPLNTVAILVKKKNKFCELITSVSNFTKPDYQGSVILAERQIKEQQKGREHIISPHICSQMGFKKVYITIQFVKDSFSTNSAVKNGYPHVKECS